MPQHIRTARPSGDMRGFDWTVTLSGGVVEGQIYMIEDTPCIAFQTAALAAIVGMHYHVDKVMVPKAAVAMNQGQKVYWSGVNGSAVTNVYQSGYYWVGIVVQDADADDDKVKIDFKGDKASLTEPL